MKSTPAMVLAGFDKRMTRQTWRSPEATSRHHLTQPAAWGSSLGEVE
ncbi:hypothetical protein [Arthrobacter sp. CAN_C5]|nr:hypothetical protein [Arthrobacter sp. CAN_C5]MBP2217027.1 hypothetical protein [Arthrobacter sp. CAN_C5]